MDGYGFRRRFEYGPDCRPSSPCAFSKASGLTLPGWLMDAGLIARMRRKDMPYDNAIMKSSFSSLK